LSSTSELFVGLA